MRCNEFRTHAQKPEANEAIRASLKKVKSEGQTQFLAKAVLQLFEFNDDWYLRYPDQVYEIAMELVQGADPESLLSIIIDYNLSKHLNELNSYQKKEDIKKFRDSFRKKWERLSNSQKTFFVSYPIKDRNRIKNAYFIRLPIDDWVKNEIIASQWRSNRVPETLIRFGNSWLRPLWMQGRKTIPNILSLFRIPIGAIVGYLLFEGYYDRALFAYTIGNFTDALDGHLAREFKADSDLGRELDRLADIFFNSCSGIVLATVALGGCFVFDILMLVLLSAMYTGSYFWFQRPSRESSGLQRILPKHSVMAALRSGVVRVFLTIIMLGHCGFGSWMFQIVLLPVWGLVAELEWKRLMKEQAKQERLSGFRREKD